MQEKMYVLIEQIQFLQLPIISHDNPALNLNFDAKQSKVGEEVGNKYKAKFIGKFQQKRSLLRSKS